MALAKFESIGTIFVASGTTAPVPKPAGLQVGELMVGIGFYNTASAVVVGLPSGFTLRDQHSNSPNEPEGFFATKVADSGDVAASTFSFTSSVTTVLLVAILRISGALNEVQAFEPGEMTDAPLGNPTLLSLLADSVDTFIIRAVGINTTVNEPSSISDPPGHTRRGIEGGALEGGGSDPVAVWWTKDAIVPASQALPSELVTLTGNSGNTRAVTYTTSYESGVGGGSGGNMGMPMDESGEAITKGQKILNPFGVKQRPCMCPMGKCSCI